MPEPEVLAHRLRMLAETETETETGGRYPAWECVNQPDDLPGHLARGRGLVARGPRGLVDGIARLLTGAGITTDVMPGRHPRRRHVTDGGPPPRLRSGRPVCHAGRSDGSPTAPRRRLTT